jgi:transcriptional regulator with XRE-family HTH domain
MNAADNRADSQPAARAGQVSSEFVSLLERYGASPRLLRRTRSVMADHPQQLSQPAGEKDAEAVPPPEAAPTEFNELLGKFRREAGLSQEELASHTGLRVDAIAALERGPMKRQTSSVLTLAAALGLSPEDRAQLLRASYRVPSGHGPIQSASATTAAVRWLGSAVDPLDESEIGPLPSDILDDRDDATPGLSDPDLNLEHRDGQWFITQTQAEAQ